MHGSEDATGILERAKLEGRARFLQYISLGYNVLEALVGLTAGVIAGSSALIGFSTDSVGETLSSVFSLWLLAHGAEARAAHAEKRAHQWIGVLFLVIGLYVAIGATHALLTQEPPDESPVGIVLAALSILWMPLLVREKRRVATALHSNALRADARQTEVCWQLSFILLLGLGLHSLFGWWWADPVAALGMLPFILRDAREGLRGKGCCEEHGHCHPAGG